MAERGTGVWRLRVYIGRDASGHPIQASRTVRVDGVRRAENELRKFIAEVEKTRSPDRTSTVANLLERWLTHVAPKQAVSTMRENRRSIEKRIVPALGQLRIDRLTPEHLDRAYSSWVAAGLSPASVRRQHAIISSALGQAVKWGWLDRNPALRATPPTVRQTGTPKTITVDELRLVLEAAEHDDPTLRTAVALAALTGCRRGEMCALRWSDIDLATGTMTISTALTAIKRSWSFGDTKTHQTRRLALGPVGLGSSDAAGSTRRSWPLTPAPAWSPTPGCCPGGPTAPNRACQTASRTGSSGSAGQRASSTSTRPTRRRPAIGTTSTTFGTSPPPRPWPGTSTLPRSPGGSATPTPRSPCGSTGTSSRPETRPPQSSSSTFSCYLPVPDPWTPGSPSCIYRRGSPAGDRRAGWRACAGRVVGPWRRSSLQR
jgi:integrase